MLVEMMESDSAFVLPSIEALSNLSLTPELQAAAVQAVLGRFDAAEAEDLPAVARFLLQNAATASELSQVVSTLRESLHFVSSSDPRLAVPDRKQKGKVLSGRESLEGRLLEGLRQALQLNPAAADAVAQELRAQKEPAQHRTVDLWLLLLLLSLSPERRRAGEALLRRKLADGHAGPAWLEHAVGSQHARVLLDFFPSLLSLARLLVHAAAQPVQATGAALYCTMFTHFTDAYFQQEVLRALHSHLGAHVGSEATSALGVLQRLAREQAGVLMRYAAFLTNILDYVGGYSGG